MNIITSKENLLIKKFNKLSLKKYRKEYSSFLVENFVIIRDSLKTEANIKTLFVTNSFIKKNIDKWSEIKDKINPQNVYLIDEKINKFLSSLDTPSGIIAEYDLLSKKIDAKKPVIYLNGINDPGNLGTILRTCTAFGFLNIVCDDKCADAYNPKTISAAKDAIFRVSLKIDSNLEFFKDNKNVPVFITDVLDGENIREFVFPENYIIVFGSESHGIENSIKEIAKNKLNIKISKNIESLNVSSALAISLYEISNK